MFESARLADPHETRSEFAAGFSHTSSALLPPCCARRVSLTNACHAQLGQCTLCIASVKEAGQTFQSALEGLASACNNPRLCIHTSNMHACVLACLLCQACLPCIIRAAFHVQVMQVGLWLEAVFDWPVAYRHRHLSSRCKPSTPHEHQRGFLLRGPHAAIVRIVAEYKS